VTGRFQAARHWLDRLLSRRLRTGTIWHNGILRKYLLYVPRHFRDQAALPLVLVFHGGAADAKQIAEASAMHLIAERQGFIVAYPAGTAGAVGLTWNPSGANGGGSSSVDDEGFVRALLTELQRRHRVDRHRVYAAGMSIGGALVYQLACSLSEQFAAVAVVAGVMTARNCNPSRPVSLLHIHGTADQRVPLAGGRGRKTARINDWPPVRDGIERWCEINGCEWPGEVIRLVDGLVGRRCRGTADVELWLVEGGRHVWPGAAARGGDAEAQNQPGAAFSASEKVWSFFESHPRSGA
jgi:polyhydroxybutyrate depolymerase